MTLVIAKPRHGDVRIARMTEELVTPHEVREIVAELVNRISPNWVPRISVVPSLQASGDFPSPRQEVTAQAFEVTIHDHPTIALYRDELEEVYDFAAKMFRSGEYARATIADLQARIEDTLASREN
jgi:hypothetical protein